MYTTNLVSPQPEAFISVKKNRLKLYENKNHYLKSKTNFEIELFNPTSNDVLAKIWLNNKLISASGIIVKAGQRVYLERYLDTPEKFQFNTYEVDDVAETQAARNTNGLVKVSFFREKMINNLWLSSGTTYTQFPSSTLTYTTNTANVNCFPNIIGGMPTGTITTTAFNSNATNGVNTLAGPNIRSKSVITDSVASVETGRVGKGKKSNQDFKQVKGDFEDWSWSSFEYQLLPESLKPLETKDIRHYCGECGVRIRKSSWKFCPNCGEAL
jgi:hypothetical protein